MAIEKNCKKDKKVLTNRNISGNIKHAVGNSNKAH